MENKEERIVERLEGNDWVPCKFMSLKKGDIFKLFDSGEDPIETGNPNIATSDAYIGQNQIWEINCDPFTEEALGDG